jgi:hypothetical protein
VLDVIRKAANGVMEKTEARLEAAS